MPRRPIYEPVYAVPEPGPSRIHLSAAGKVSSVYELGKGFFTPLSLSQPSVRAEEIRRLLDMIHVCLERGDRVRATRAWSILVRCHEVKPASQGWSALAKEFEQQGRHKQARTIHSMTDRLLVGIARGPARDDLEYLETHIMSFPFSEDAPLHVYAGLLALYLGQESAAAQHARQPSASASSDTEMSSEADAAPESSQQQSSQRAPRLVPILPGYLSSAQTYLQSALKLYEKDKKVDSAAAVAYVEQLLRLLRKGFSDEAQSDGEEDEAPRLSAPLHPQSHLPDTPPPAPRRRRLNLSDRTDAHIEGEASAQRDLFSRLTL